ncbi:UTP--glucose-1-phosphate uridylyltransferase [Dendrobium catenatum]|uniref:UTP--glucose-1-phosphate uridylyltransferase n=1 Tax=Dendrobium catenatum TaxID=906689 RepID=A0A2I0V866_9ASPA|nr:UTP--glucose-1-phosphate uridylyltransferase [Dendrobium catenatum]
MAAVASETKKISKLQTIVAGLDQVSEDEKSGFISLVSRCLSGEAEHVEWSKILTPTDKVFMPYESLAIPHKDLEAIKKMLDKISQQEVWMQCPFTLDEPVQYP